MNKLIFLYNYKTIIISSLLVMFCTFSFGQDFNKAVKKTDTIPQSSKVKTIPQLRLGMQIGYGYRIAPAPETNNTTLQSHFNKLKHNFSFGTDISYFFTNYMGVGLKYNATIAHVITDSIFYAFADGAKHYDYLSELVDIHYIAPFLSTQIFTVPHK